MTHFSAVTPSASETTVRPSGPAAAPSNRPFTAAVESPPRRHVLARPGRPAGNGVRSSALRGAATFPYMRPGRLGTLLAYDEDTRREAVRLVRSHGGAMGDKAIERILFHHWCEFAFGRRPNARTVRRWLRDETAGREIPTRPYRKRGRTACQTVGANDGKAADSVRRRPRFTGRPGRVRIPHGHRTPHVRFPELRIGQLVAVDGETMLFLGRTATGRLAFAGVVVPGARAPFRTVPATRVGIG